MKQKMIIVDLLILIFFISCDPSGKVFLTNAYPYAVIVSATYNFKGTLAESSIKCDVGNTFVPDAMGHIEYNNIVALRIKTNDGLLLADYSPEVLQKIRNAYKIKVKQQETWIFSEKGVFLNTNEINRKYHFDKSKILEYYNSDEAVKNLEFLLQSN